MDQDPHTGTGQDAGHSYGYGSEAEIERETASARGYPRPGSAPIPAGKQGPHPDEVGRIRMFLEDQLRERPLPTLLLGVLAGWLAGKLLR
ncbi:MAG TPA: hypothetical protein VFZ18_04530 [Longimicrobiaceae bacterium]